jgi:hypothetical protein
LLDVIVSGAADGIPTLAADQLAERRAPSGRAWAKLRNPSKGRSLDRVADSLVVEVSGTKIRVWSLHPGAGYLNYGRGGHRVTGVRKNRKSGELTATTQREQPERPFLPPGDLPPRWKTQIRRWVLGDLAHYLGIARGYYRRVRRALRAG